MYKKEILFHTRYSCIVLITSTKILHRLDYTTVYELLKILSGQILRNETKCHFASNISSFLEHFFKEKNLNQL